MSDIFLAVKKHPIQFIVLTLILLVGGAMFVYFNYNPELQRDVVYFTGGAYFIWSLYHHYKRGDLHVSLVLEYLVLILFASILLTKTLF